MYRFVEAFVCLFRTVELPGLGVVHTLHEPLGKSVRGHRDHAVAAAAPIYTGTPGEPPKSRPREKTNDNAFKELLEQRLKEESQVSFSKHAMERVVERGVDVSSEKLDRLNEGVRMAEEKGLREPLILLGTTAFVVNVKNNKVVTVVNEDSLKGTVFTNIDGTVMI